MITKKYKIGFIGLGVMGSAMAGHLSKAGHNLVVYNRSTDKSKKWVKKYKGTYVLSAKEVALEADIVFTCVRNDNDMYELMLGKNGIIPHIKKKLVIVDHTTASATLAETLAKEASKYNKSFLDAPVSGGQIGAEKGQLISMVGGKQSVYNQTKFLLNCYCKKSVWMGKSGNGQLTKMINQICIAGVIQGLAEGLTFAQKEGLDGKKILEALSEGAAQSWQMNNRLLTMLNGEFNFGFAVDLMRKDLSICLTRAQQNNIALPITALIDQFYALLQNKNMGHLDTSSLIKIFDK
ncbi:MAG: NAD(P)-dependent oxidoreductase [Alphaproteobacteria bacterium]|nr:NAD(P)-dependent oxidoreductase [Alphaproteobacteria bacterium]